MSTENSADLLCRVDFPLYSTAMVSDRNLESVDHSYLYNVV